MGAWVDMVADIPIIILLVFLEAAYDFIGLKAILREKLNAWRYAGLFFGIIAANMASMIVSATPFRFLAVAFMLFGIMKLIARESTRFYHVFLIMAILTTKVALEIGYMMLLINNVTELTINGIVIAAAALLIFPVVMFKPTRALTAFIDRLWHKERTFWVRYVLVAIMMVLMFLLIHGMVLFAEHFAHIFV